MTTSIIIPVWNGLASLPGCLASVAALQGDEIEVIAVDNGSQDGSDAFIANKYPQVKLIRNAYNLGFGAACNQGMDLASGELIVLLNQDTQLSPAWLAAVQMAITPPDVGIVGCKIYYEDGVTIQHAGAWVEWPLGIVHHYGVGEVDTGQWDKPGPVEIVTFAAVAIRRKVVEAVGSFDPGFGLGYYEDVDYCLRARKAGFQILYTPRATLRHQESSSLKGSERIQYQYQQGRLRLLLKHLSLPDFLTEFVAAEVESQKLAIRNQVDSSALRWAYLAAMSMAAEFYSDQENPGQLSAVHDALYFLYRTAWSETGTAAKEAPPQFAIPAAVKLTGLGDDRDPVVRVLSGQQPFSTVGPALTLFDFSSGAPLVGPVISRFRRFWYNISARWGDLHLLQHLAAILARQVELTQWLIRLTGFQSAQANLNGAQEEFNRRLEEEVRSLSKQVAGLTAQNGLLARQLAEMKSEFTDPVLTEAKKTDREKQAPYAWRQQGTGHEDES